MEAVDAIYNFKTSPPSFIIEDENGIRACYQCNKESIFEEVNAEILEKYFSIEPLTIRIEEKTGPFAGDAPAYFEQIDIVIRPTLLPITLSAESECSGRRIQSSHSDVKVHLKNH